LRASRSNFDLASACAVRISVAFVDRAGGRSRFTAGVPAMYALGQSSGVFLGSCAGHGGAPAIFPHNYSRFTTFCRLACRLLSLLAVNEDCGSPDCFGHAWPNSGTSPGPSMRKPGAVVAMPRGSHVPVSDRMRFENRMTHDAIIRRRISPTR
jgi:hypothetical protein